MPGEGAIAKFSNVVVRTDVAFDFAAVLAKTSTTAGPPSASELPSTVVGAWSVSRSFVSEDSSAHILPRADIAGSFKRFDTEPDGLLELHRHVAVPNGSRVTAAVARVNVRAATAGRYAFELGFSDIATVFVNGTPVFRGDASYSFGRPRREGLIGFDQARIYLPLSARDNDLSVVVSDSFGGWGLMGRFVDAPGVTVQAR